MDREGDGSRRDTTLRNVVPYAGHDSPGGLRPPTTFCEAKAFSWLCACTLRCAPQYLTADKHAGLSRSDAVDLHRGRIPAHFPGRATPAQIPSHVSLSQHRTPRARSFHAGGIKLPEWAQVQQNFLQCLVERCVSIW